MRVRGRPYTRLTWLGGAWLSVSLWTLACDASDSDANGGQSDASDAATQADQAAAAVTGRACEESSECGEGFNCYTLAPGGYCMPGAAGGPTACREPEVPCPEGTTCSPLPFHAISGVCLLDCTSTDDCRSGYLCNEVELFPGETDTPRSANPVCWATCEVGMDQTCNDDPTISSLHGTCQEDGSCLCGVGFEKNPETGRCL